MAMTVSELIDELRDATDDQDLQVLVSVSSGELELLGVELYEDDEPNVVVLNVGREVR